MRNADRQRRELLDAATRLIAEAGYYGLSLDALCEAAACSKSSVYAHFGNKEGLMVALVEQAAGRFTQALHALYLPELGTAEALVRYACGVLDHALDPAHCAVLGGALGAPQHIELGQRYTRTALATTENALAQFLAAKATGGELEVADAERAAAEFHALVLGGPLLRALLGGEPAAPPGTRETLAQSAVRVFLAAYAKSDEGPPDSRV